MPAYHEKDQLTDIFEIIETGDPNGPRKQQGILHVLAQWPGLQKDEVVYVGDMPADVTASRAAGVPIIGAAWAPTTDAGELQASGPDTLFYNVRDFAAWLLPLIA